jgi:AraC-like DNA-binding protein
MALVATVERGDVLTEVLGTLGLEGRVFCRAELSAPWSLALPASGGAHFHVLERGAGWVRVDGASAPIALARGDLVIVPHGGGHVLCDHLETPPVRLEQVLRQGTVEQHFLRHGGGGAEACLICGSFHFAHAAEHPLLGVLPPLIHLPAAGGEAAEWLTSSLQLLAFEARTLRPGAKAVISRLTEIIFVQAVRLWIASQPLAQGGWLGALRDPQIGAALTLIHQAPAQAWRVATLAREVAMSRSPFAARFTALVGEPPLTYLTRWRLHLATSLLQDGRLSVSEVAARVGYASTAAFSKAFKRRFGAAPALYTHRQTRRGDRQPVTP